ncbi:hypothetical protein [Erwinia sp. 9145]|uniref:hypothetical protein n=1 Tax=Erwinia sp. 9145 TaxID=1500895 RepID=UPI00068BC654|nr:hypothetical protein [Erwinia sp. 9145]
MEWSEEQAGRWLHWWHQGYWQQADASWQENSFFALPPEQQQRLCWQHPQAVATGFAIRPALPPAPQARLLAFIDLPADARAHSLGLLAGICAPQSAPEMLTSANLIWCRRLTKALRCDNWLSNDCFHPWTTGSLLLLRGLSPESWPRLRLLFPRGWAMQVDEYPAVALPASRLAALWDAVIWQIQQPESALHVDPQENNPAE